MSAIAFNAVAKIAAYPEIPYLSLTGEDRQAVDAIIREFEERPDSASFLSSRAFRRTQTLIVSDFQEENLSLSTMLWEESTQKNLNALNQFSLYQTENMRRCALGLSALREIVYRGEKQYGEKFRAAEKALKAEIKDMEKTLQKAARHLLFLHQVADGARNALFCQVKAEVRANALPGHEPCKPL